jgi:hypothetical protein
MFSNGTQYNVFEENNCNKCPFYVHYEDVTKNKPICKIEERIALSAHLDRKEALKTFPYEWLDDNGSMGLYTCRKKIGKKKEMKNRIKVIEEAKEEEVSVKEPINFSGFEALNKYTKK